MSCTLETPASPLKKLAGKSRSPVRPGTWRCAGLTDYGVMWISVQLKKTHDLEKVVWLHPMTGKPLRADQRRLPKLSS